MFSSYRLPFILRLFIAGAAGAVAPLTLAPYGLWHLALLSIPVFAFLLRGLNGRQCGLVAFAFGLGLYGVGASWVYVSIHQFGSTSLPLSLLMTSTFVSGLALCFALPFCAYGRWLSDHPLATLWAFPAIYVLGEWMRSWFLTGFPWLYLGYGHIYSPLSGWAPIFGVFGLSFMLVLTGTTLLEAVTKNAPPRARLIAAVIVIACWGIGAPLKHINWTEIDPKPITIGMAQGNIPQELKWERFFLDETFRIFHSLSDDLWQKDWVIWPEAAIPLLYSEAKGDLDSLDRQAKKTDTVFITGILYDDWSKVKGDGWENIRYYNSLVALGQGSGISYKTRLVPFGEYVPMENWLRGMIQFFNLPTSIIHPGPAYKEGLNANGVIIAPTICYEVVYPDLVAERAVNADVLLTVSNDAWFGLSIGPIQHFEMAQMRALETGRYLIRSTNNGLSGIVDAKGRILVQGGRYTRESISGTVHAAKGKTPFLIWRSYPTILICFLLLGWMGWLIRQARAKAIV